MLFDIISRWYDPSETAKTTIEGLVSISVKMQLSVL